MQISFIESLKEKISLILANFTETPIKSVFLIIVGIILFYFCCKNFRFLLAFFLSLCAILLCYRQQFFFSFLPEINLHLLSLIVGAITFCICHFLIEIGKIFLGKETDFLKTLFYLPKKLILFSLFLFITWIILSIAYYNSSVYKIKTLHYSLLNRTEIMELTPSRTQKVRKIISLIPWQHRKEIFPFGNQAKLNLAKLLFIQEIDKEIFYKQSKFLSKKEINEIIKLSQKTQINQLVSKVKYGQVLRSQSINQFLKEKPKIETKLAQQQLNLL